MEFWALSLLQNKISGAQIMFRAISVALTTAERTFMCCINFSVDPSVRVLERKCPLIHSFISWQPLWAWLWTWEYTARKAIIFKVLVVSRDISVCVCQIIWHYVSNKTFLVVACLQIGLLGRPCPLLTCTGSWGGCPWQEAAWAP